MDTLNKHIDLLYEIIPNQVYGYEDDTMEGVVGDLLTAQNASISTAESCTGGAVAKMITSVSGSSNYFEGSVIFIPIFVKLINFMCRKVHYMVMELLAKR